MVRVARSQDSIDELFSTDNWDVEDGADQDPSIHFVGNHSNDHVQEIPNFADFHDESYSSEPMALAAGLVRTPVPTAQTTVHHRPACRSAVLQCKQNRWPKTLPFNQPESKPLLLSDADDRRCS